MIDSKKKKKFSLISMARFSFVSPFTSTAISLRLLSPVVAAFWSYKQSCRILILLLLLPAAGTVNHAALLLGALLFLLMTTATTTGAGGPISLLALAALG